VQKKVFKEFQEKFFFFFSAIINLFICSSLFSWNCQTGFNSTQFESMTWRLFAPMLRNKTSPFCFVLQKQDGQEEDGGVAKAHVT
jgi:hypothetical protein